MNSNQENTTQKNVITIKSYQHPVITEMITPQTTIILEPNSTITTNAGIYQNPNSSSCMYFTPEEDGITLVGADTPAEAAVH